MQRKIHPIGAIVAPLIMLLAACGGNGGGDNPSTESASGGQTTPATQGAGSGAGASDAAPRAGQLRATVEGQTFVLAVQNCAIMAEQVFINASEADVRISAQAQRRNQEWRGQVQIYRGSNILYTSETQGTTVDVQISGRNVTYTAEFAKPSGGAATSVGSGTINATCD